MSKPIIMVVVVIDVVFVKKLLQSGVGSMQESNERHLPIKAPLKIMGTKFFGPISFRPKIDLDPNNCQICLKFKNV